MILIVTNKDDIHADFVIQRLKERKVEFLRVNTEDFPMKLKGIVRLGQEESEMLLMLPAGVVDFAKVTSVWYRRPAVPVLDPRIVIPEIREHTEREALSFLDGLWFSTGCLWVNHPISNQLAGEKIYQLKVADGLGFSIPDTLVTNEPSEARAFLSRHGKVVVKPLKRSMVTLGGEERAFYTSLVTSEYVDRLEAVSLGPHLFQGYVPKAFELRITVIGDKVFTAAIDSQSTEAGLVDWRMANMESLPYYIYELPEHIKTLCLQLNRRFGLSFSAIDMIVTPEGKYVFLEVNPNGQWVWLELATKMPMIEAMVSLLDIKGG